MTGFSSEGVDSDVIREPTRHTCAYKIPTTDLSELKRLSSYLKDGILRDFTSNYGDLLSILNTPVDPMALITLLQFYDPKIRCFTFQDYQLVPTLEEFSYLLKVRIANEVPFAYVPEKVKIEVLAKTLHLSCKEVKVNWRSNGDAWGFCLSFLVGKAEDLAKKENWVDFSLLFALMMYGIVLFPQKENFVDLAAMCIFMSKNPVPTLLADTLYTIHSRHGKKGNVGFCHLMLYQWLLLHLPVNGPFVDAKATLQWSSRLVALTSADIRWNYVTREVRSIITSCGGFPNVPLMGTKGCINYNPVLAYRQLGYAMDDEPSDVEISESVYFAKGSDPEMLKRVVHAWRKINTKDKFTLSKKVPIARAPYMDWVKKRSRDLKLPFSRTTPLYEQPPAVLSDTVPAELYVQSQADNIKLRSRDREVGLELYMVDQERARLARRLKEVESESSGPVRVRKRPSEDAEGQLCRKQQECLKLQKSESGYKRKIEELEKQLKAEKDKTARAIFQQHAAEIELEEVREENARLKARVPLPDCSECKTLIEHCQYLESRIARGDSV